MTVVESCSFFATSSIFFSCASSNALWDSVWAPVCRCFSICSVRCLIVCFNDPSFVLKTWNLSSNSFSVFFNVLSFSCFTREHKERSLFWVSKHTMHTMLRHEGRVESHSWENFSDPSTFRQKEAEWASTMSLESNDSKASTQAAENLDISFSDNAIVSCSGHRPCKVQSVRILS